MPTSAWLPRGLRSSNRTRRTLLPSCAAACRNDLLTGYMQDWRTGEPAECASPRGAPHRRPRARITAGRCRVQQRISEVRSSPYRHLGKRHPASARLRSLRRAWTDCCRTMARAHAVTIACDKQPENSAGDLRLCRAPRCMQRPPSALRSPRRPPQAQGTTTPTCLNTGRSESQSHRSLSSRDERLRGSGLTHREKGSVAIGCAWPRGSAACAGRQGSGGGVMPSVGRAGSIV